VAPVASLSGKQKKNDIGGIYALLNVLKWQASPSPSIAGYIILSNSNQIDQVDASTLQYEQQVSKKGPQITYSVIAFDSLGNRSTPVTVTIK